MKSGTIKSALCIASLLFAAGYAGSAAAHFTSGLVTDNTNAGATEGWAINCPAGTTELETSIQYTSNLGGGPLGVVTATTTKGIFGRSAMDDTTGAGFPGLPVITVGGEGTYNVTIQRTTVGRYNYVLNTHCNPGDVNPLSVNQTINN